jgi:hypothetical protein
VKNWFTIHSPHGYRGDYPWHIYLQNKHKKIVSNIKDGDRVFFYETKTSKHVEAKNEIGRMGLVRVGYVNGKAYDRPAKKLKYTDGEIKNWSIGIPTNEGNADGFVAREQVVEILGYSKNYYFRGFAGGTGIMQIDARKAQNLLELFQVSAR